MSGILNQPAERPPRAVSSAGGFYPKVDDPTEAEIAAACAEIRAGWSDAERRNRALGLIANGAGGRSVLNSAVDFWTPPVVRMAKGGR